MGKRTKLILGVGLNDANYQVTASESSREEDGRYKTKLLWICPFYIKWCNMLRRCYSQKTQNQSPSYIGCSVCDDWLTFSNFKRWMETQDWQGKQLDKDILQPGNKVYGPDSCIFVSQAINNFFVTTEAREVSSGVHWHKRVGKFQVSVGDGCGEEQYLGYFDTETKARLAWLKAKQELARKLAYEQTDPRVAKALIERYENYVAQEKKIA